MCNQTAKNRSLDPETNCECHQGYYSENGEIDCKKCPVNNCKSCDSQGLCLECSNKNLLPPFCEKQKTGFFIVNPSDAENSPV